MLSVENLEKKTSKAFIDEIPQIFKLVGAEGKDQFVARGEGPDNKMGSC